MNEKIKVGVLGAGNIFSAHVQGLQFAAEECEVVAVAEPNEKRHAYIRESFPDVKIVRDYQEVLAMPEITAVINLLPHDIHMSSVIEAAKAKKQILVEKVMGRNIWECDGMVEVCEQNKVTLTVSHDRRYLPQWKALKAIVDSGQLGEIFFIRLEHNQNVVLDPKSWAFSRDGLGGGAVMSCLTHQIDALRWYAGEAAEVTGMTKVLPERMEGESLGIIAAQMRSGALAQLTINWFTRCYKGQNSLWYEMVQICGTKGEAYFRSDVGTFYLLHGKATDSGPVLYGKSDPGCYENFVKADAGLENVMLNGKEVVLSGHMNLIKEWLKLLRGESNQITTTGRDARSTVEVAEALYRSEEKRCTVTLPIPPVPWKS